MHIAPKHLNLLKDLLSNNTKNKLKIRIYGESMIPTFQHLQFVEMVPIKDNVKHIKKNDIIVYKKFTDHFTVHRVIYRITFFHKYIFLTKGDNNSHRDHYCVFGQDVIGIVPE